MAHGHLDFTFSLHHRLAPAGEPLCWSPYSVLGALGMAATATAGSTRDELAAALRAADDLDAPLKLSAAAAELGDTSGASEEPVLAVANALWVQDGLPLHEEAVRALSAWPGSGLRAVPFQSRPQQARALINADVAETTRGLIPELLAPGVVTEDTTAALVNALYLKASWLGQFDKAATADRPFHTPHGTRAVATMHTTRRFGYAARDGWQIVTLPAAGAVEAVILLPDHDLAEADEALDGRTAGDLLGAVSQQRVELLLPRFGVTGEADLARPLAALGVQALFAPGADFSPLTDRPMSLSTAVHKAVLRVDEAGLEGAAATAAVLRIAAVTRQPRPIRVVVDRPFLFLVRHRDSGALYFLARVVDPG